MSDIDYDLWCDIEMAESLNDIEDLKQLFNLITAKELNTSTEFDPDFTLLQKLIKEFDKANKYPDLLNDLFSLPNVDPKDVNINSINLKDGTTPLINAASRGHLKLLETMLFWNVNPHIKSNNQMTAFTYACNHVHINIAKYLSCHVTKEELHIKHLNTGYTIKEELQIRQEAQPNEPKFEELLKIIQNIEINHKIGGKKEQWLY